MAMVNLNSNFVNRCCILDRYSYLPASIFFERSVLVIRKQQIEPLPVSVNVQSSEDIIALRSQVRHVAASLGMGLADQARAVMCSTELGENLLKHVNVGHCFLTVVHGDRGEAGVCIECVDQGEGIDDIDAVLCEHRGGKPRLLGAGLIGVKRVADHFELRSDEQGTTVRACCFASTGAPSFARPEGTGRLQ